MKNNVIINTKPHINENCLMLQSEMSIQETVKDCASCGSADGSHLLHLCSDHFTEYDPGVVFIFYLLFFLLKTLLFYETYTYIQVLIKKNA